MATKKPGQRNDDYADPYEESYETIDGDLSTGALRHWTYDISYYSRFSGDPNTVRATNATPPMDSRADKYPDDCVTFYYDDNQYAFVPGDRRLVSVGNDQNNVTLAEGDEVFSIKRVDYPPGAPLIGAEQTGVVATVYYYSARTGDLTSMEMYVDREESDFWRLTGHRVDDDTTVEVITRSSRDVTARHYGSTGTITLGKTARVEFPQGHSYTVDVHGLPDDKAEKYVEHITTAVNGVYKYDEVDAKVTHEGRIEDN